MDEMEIKFINDSHHCSWWVSDFERMSTSNFKSLHCQSSIISFSEVLFTGLIDCVCIAEGTLIGRIYQFIDK